MNNTKTKLLTTIIMFVVLAILPIIANAANESDVAIVNTEENGYVIYIENYTGKNFKYAFSNNQNESEINLNYINSTLDNNGNQEAYLDEDTYNSINNSTIYLYVKDGEDLIISGYELNFENSILKSEIETVENTTKRINVDTTKTIVTTETVDGVVYTVTTGAVEIKDDENSKYQYQNIKLPSTEEYNSLMTLAQKINSEYEDLDIYNKVVLAKQFNTVYAELIKSAKWEDVNDMIIAQPEDTESGVQYILLISKDGEIFDAQFLTSVKDYDQEYVKETKVTTETSKLPITFDSIGLIIIFAIIVCALIVVFVRIKSLNKNNKEEE